jgi:hypothetical protein
MDTQSTVELCDDGEFARGTKKSKPTAKEPAGSFFLTSFGGNDSDEDIDDDDDNDADDDIITVAESATKPPLLSTTLPPPPPRRPQFATVDDLRLPRSEWGVAEVPEPRTVHEATRALRSLLRRSMALAGPAVSPSLLAPSLLSSTTTTRANANTNGAPLLPSTRLTLPPLPQTMQRRVTEQDNTRAVGKARTLMSTLRVTLPAM